MFKIWLPVFCFFVACVTANASIVTIADMNADDEGSGNQLEGTLGGTGVGGSSGFSITSGVVSTQSSSTSATYLVTDVDLDDDNVFAESFSFSITFASASGINFSSSQETFGVDDESVSLNESFSLTFDLLSDSSSTHDVVFDGLSSIDFVSLTGSNFEVTDGSGTETFTSVGGANALPRLFVDPSFQYVTGGDLTDTGTVEDWSIQFSTQAVPEPATFAMFGVALVGLGFRRRK